MNPLDRDGGPSAPRSRLGASSTRRTFMKRALGGLTIAIPAYHVLIGGMPAEAATNPCQEVRLSVVGSWCVGQGSGSDWGCKGPDVSACMTEYKKVSIENGEDCGTFIEKNGYCYELEARKE